MKGLFLTEPMRVTEEALHLRKIFMITTDQKNRSVTEAIGGGAVFIEEISSNLLNPCK